MNENNDDLDIIDYENSYNYFSNYIRVLNKKNKPVNIDEIYENLYIEEKKTPNIYVKKIPITTEEKIIYIKQHNDLLKYRLIDFNELFNAPEYSLLRCFLKSDLTKVRGSLKKLNTCNELEIYIKNNMTKIIDPNEYFIFFRLKPSKNNLRTLLNELMYSNFKIKKKY
jgi:hypothetical protein